jgi:hypothetical protein
MSASLLRPSVSIILVLIVLQPPDGRLRHLDVAPRHQPHALRAPRRQVVQLRLSAEHYCRPCKAQTRQRDGVCARTGADGGPCAYLSGGHSDYRFGGLPTCGGPFVSKTAVDSYDDWYVVTRTRLAYRISI